MEHSPVSPSSAKRWMTCPASVAYTRALPELSSRSSMAAEEGRLAHQHAEDRLKAYVKNECVKGMINSKPMANAVDEYCSIVESYIDVADRYGIEDKVAAPSIHEQMFGTVDFWAMIGTQLVVVDFKYGRWPVSAVDNPQLELYALMVEETYKLTPWTYKLQIVQPRSKYSVVRVSLVDSFSIKKGPYKLAVNIAMDADTTLTYASRDACQFCPGRNVCPDQYELKGGFVKL